MASALQLTATATIIGGHGLAPNASVISALNTFKAHTPITLISTAFSTALSSNASSILMPILNNLGSTSQGQWLLDLYPANITPVASTGVVYYANATYPRSASVSNTVLNQVNAPFAYGMQGFANVYQIVSGSATSSFDMVASVNLLQGKTYAQSGLGYAGPSDLFTNGINNAGTIISNVVSKWGTMYDINNMNTVGNPYVFGQNLLNQNLGTYGNLSAQLTATGLDVTNLLQIPHNTTTTTVSATTTTANTTIGAIELPTLSSSTTTTVVSGSSPRVVSAIYNSITGGNLQAIVAATNVTVSNVSITSLNDYLDLNKIVDATTWSQLNALGIANLSAFGSFVHSKIGDGRFKNWADVGTTLASLSTPALLYTTTTSGSPVLSSSVVSTLNSFTGTGSGTFGNPVIGDYFGATSGNPYTAGLTTINSNYTSLQPAGLVTAINTLNSDIATYITQYNAHLIDPANVAMPSSSSVTSDVSAINSSINSVSSSATQAAYYTILNKITTEVNNLSKVGIVFDAALPSALSSFAQGFGSTASDSTQLQTYQFFSNIITADGYGDTIRSAIAEAFNIKLLQSKGISFTTDPSPTQMIQQAQQQNIPLSTYISRNK